MLWFGLGAAGALRRRATGAATGCARPAVVGGSYLISTSIKLAIGRKRPVVEDLPHLMATPTGLSFPSSHSTPRSRPRAPTGRCCPPAPLYAGRVRDGVLAPVPRRALPVRHRRRRGARQRLGHTGTMMKVGIVGLPNAGKSSLFNALSRAGAEAANYPFTTIEPNVAVVPVADERLDAVARDDRRLEHRARTRSSSTTSPAWSRARTRARASATSSSPTSARRTRCCTSCAATHDENVIHPDGRVSPAADIETIETELIFADLEQAERRHARVVREARGGDRAAQGRGGVAGARDRGAAVRAARALGARARTTRRTRSATCRR